MNYFDEELYRLQQQKSIKKQMESELRNLDKQREELRRKVRELEKCKWSEEADVDRLEGRSLAVFFYKLTGRQEEMLSKEREEAYTAALKFDAAMAELEAVEQEIDLHKRKLAEVRNCEEQYEEVLKNKLEIVKIAGGTAAENIFRMEEKMAGLDSQIREIQEAISSGYHAMQIAERIQASLDSAEGWATWDMLGGGIIADALKYSHMDAAQGEIEDLQVALRHFKTELADVTIYADLQIRVDGLLQFADYFFDGLFVDWTVKNRINQSMEQIQNTISQIKCVIEKLDYMKRAAEQEKEEIKRHMELQVLNA